MKTHIAELLHASSPLTQRPGRASRSPPGRKPSAISPPYWAGLVISRAGLNFGEQQVQEFHIFRDQIRLVLLDVMLPKLSGPEVYVRIRQVRPDLPAIFATGYSPDFALLQKVQQEGWPVIQKPYSSRTLARKVRETLDQRAHVFPPINHD